MRLGPDGRKFPWGKIIRIHEIGPYAIVEFEESSGSIGFHAFVDGKDTSCGASSLDGAILIAIATRRGDVRAAHYMAKLAGVDE